MEEETPIALRYDHNAKPRNTQNGRLGWCLGRGKGVFRRQVTKTLMRVAHTESSLETT